MKKDQYLNKAEPCFFVGHFSFVQLFCLLIINMNVYGTYTKMIKIYILLVISVLPELPLPTSLPNAVNTKSLLDNPKLVHEVDKLLSSKDKPLVEKLVQALRQSSTEHM